MTNYPRDEFDRVPEFNTRVGSHHAHGWAQSVASKAPGGKLRWVVVAAVAVIIVGLLAYFFGPSGGAPLGVGSTTTASQNPEETGGENQAQSAEPSESESASQSPSESPSSTIDDSEVLYGQLIGVYNGSNTLGAASLGQDALTEAGFTNVATGDWTKSSQTTDIYYSSDAYRATAEKIAEIFGVDEVYQTTNIPNRVTVVMGSDNVLETQ
ncbi:LytR C-terminal domain-containing protein [Glutamicibacter sp.]|uniref:LytR C-terminal domain-containing protein n=1 Tax=Glutamicibacter sp. TaxID=1931995 RepID=UPI0028BF452D|nr:LytR C-terminal domain-containing protein [Glutamicibacter sp.]